MVIAKNPFGRVTRISRRTLAPAVAAPGTADTSGSRTGVLVLIAMYGGNDGENTIIPYNDPAYLGGRPTLGYQPHEVIPLDKDLALHPGLTGMKGLWDAKQLAIVRGVGYPEPNHSHFRSMDIWQSAVPERDELTGWIGRWLDTGGGKDPLAALSLGPTLPKILGGRTTAGAAIPAGTLALPKGGRIEGPFATVESGQVPGSLAARVARSGTDLLPVIHSVKDVLASQPASAFTTSLEGAPAETAPKDAVNPGGAGKPLKPKGGGLSSQLDLVARLIKGGLPTRVYVVGMGGFDTHTNERANHANLMSELDTGITSFVKAMSGDPRGKEVVVMTFSEFGRRVAQNASGGTDHGTAAPLFVAGPGVKGGYYGEQPGLATPDLDHGDLRFTTDFRSVYSTVADRILGADPAALLGPQRFPTLDFI